MKKTVTLLLVVIFSLSVLSASAAFSAPEATLYVSGRDADGFVTLTLKLSGIEFQGVQVSVFYNPEELLLTKEMVQNMSVGEMYKDGKTTMNAVQTKLQPENRCFSVTAIMNLSLMNDEIYSLSSFEKEMEIFSLRVPATTDKPEIGFALKESAVHDKSNLDGLVVSLNGESQTANTSVCYADGTIGQIGRVSAPEKPKTVEELRAERILNTAILQKDNYAAVKNGALCYIDETNKAVMPFEQDGELYIPYRFVFEAFGRNVFWDEEKQNPYYILDGQQIYIADADFVLKEKRSFIPFSKWMQLTGIGVTQVGKCLVFTDINNPWDAEGVIEQGILSDAMFIMSPAIRDMK